jgi:hypothetical protein
MDQAHETSHVPRLLMGTLSRKIRLRLRPRDESAVRPSGLIQNPSGVPARVTCPPRKSGLPRPSSQPQQPGVCYCPKGLAFKSVGTSPGANKNDFEHKAFHHLRPNSAVHAVFQTRPAPQEGPRNLHLPLRSIDFANWRTQSHEAYISSLSPCVKNGLHFQASLKRNRASSGD